MTALEADMTWRLHGRCDPASIGTHQTSDTTETVDDAAPETRPDPRAELRALWDVLDDLGAVVQRRDVDSLRDDIVRALCDHEAARIRALLEGEAARCWRRPLVAPTASGTRPGSPANVDVARRRPGAPFDAALAAGGMSAPWLDRSGPRPAQESQAEPSHSTCRPTSHTQGVVR